MTFVYLKYLPVILILFIGFAWYWVRFENRYFKWVEKYWFYKKATRVKVAAGIYLAAFFLFLLALADLRGPIHTIQSTIPDQKTIILLDASSSMLVEDVHPNRFIKSLLMARHFIKNAVGHQIAIVMFSGNANMVVPFTDDIDFLDSAVAGLSGINITKNATDIESAISETIQIFKANNSTKNESFGNILLFTDGQNNSQLNPEMIKSQGYNEINLAIIGVGTSKGGKIPLRSKTFGLRGFKKYKGKEIISKLNDLYFKQLSKRFKYSKFWVPMSLDLPTEEVLSFTRSRHQLGSSSKIIQVRKTYHTLIIIPAILLFIIFVILTRGKIYFFKSIWPILFVICLGTFGHKAASSEKMSGYHEQIAKKLSLLQKGDLKKDEKQKLAELLLRSEKSKEAEIIYYETLGMVEKQDDFVLFNYATALLLNLKTQEALSIYKMLKERIGSPKGESEERKAQLLLDAMRSNLLYAISMPQDSKNNKREEQGRPKTPKKMTMQKTREQISENGQQIDKKKSRPQVDIKPSSVAERESMLKAKLQIVRIPSILKQLISDDRRLQKKYVERKFKKQVMMESPKDW